MTHSENESEKSSPKRAKIESVSTKVMFRLRLDYVYTTPGRNNAGRIYEHYTVVVF